MGCSFCNKSTKVLYGYGIKVALKLKLLINGKGWLYMDDRRVFARFPVKFGLRFLNLWEGKEGKSVTQDISAKGVCVLFNESLPLYTALELWISVPDKNEPLYTRGEVVWVNKAHHNKYSVGICLEKADLMGVSRSLTAA